MIGITHADMAWYDNANNRFRHIDVDPYCKQEYQFTYHVIWKSRPERRDWVRMRHLTKILEFTIISDVNWISYQRRPLGTDRNIPESAEVGGNVLKPNDIILFVFCLCLRHGPKLAFRCRPFDRQKSHPRRSAIRRERNSNWYTRAPSSHKNSTLI